jgi:uncharacterized protein (TIGR04222 family)
MSSRYRILAFMSVLVVLLVVASPAQAQDKTLRWHRWDADIQINSDGTFTVREEYEIEFIGGPFTFGYRNIPISQFESLANISVWEGGIQYSESYSQQPDTFYWTKDEGQYVINWFYPSTWNATRVFTVQYTVVGGLIINEQVGDRFFWKAVGPEHAYPIESSTVTVRMPPGAVVDTSLEPAYFGVNATYSLSEDLTTVTYYATSIPANQYFEVGVRFPHGFVPNVRPSWQAAYEEQQRWNEEWRPMANVAAGGMGILLLIGGTFGVYFLWVLRGRDPKVGSVPSLLTEPPSDLPPGLAGTLLDERADLQDIIATLIDLARRGALEIEEREVTIFGITTSRKFVYHRKPDFSEPLRPYEQSLLKAVFGSKQEVELDDLRERFYASIPRIQRELYEEAVKEGLFPSSPRAIRTRYVVLGVAGLVLSVGVGFCVAAGLLSRVDAILCPFISLAIVSIAMIVVAQVMPTKSRKGAEEAAKWRAFKAYLASAERYADLAQVTDQFDRYLPYAIAFGIERTWVNKFARIPSTPVPRWYFPMGIPYPYYGSGGSMLRGKMAGEAAGELRDLRGEAVRPTPSLDGMSSQMFGSLSGMAGGLFSMLNSTANVFTSVPHSSGSGHFGGGFSGGGFSGGGGGGGGGAGFG